MDIECLSAVLEKIAFPGGTLSVEERAAMEPALFLLQQSYQFTEMRFWGRIRGLERDYFICQGSIDENGKLAPFDAPKATFKSTDGIVWTPLVEVDEVMAAKCAQFNGYFTGDLAKIYGSAPVEAEAEEGAPPAEDTVTEEKRLAAFVQAVDAQCAVVPTGAYQLDARHRVVLSNTYRGLSMDAALDKSTFLHLRKPCQFDKLKVYEQKGLTQGTDFLDTIEADQPEGAWNLRFDAGSQSAHLRHNVYSGFMAYATISPLRKFGYAYFGDGIRNDDLAFMLP